MPLKKKIKAYLLKKIASQKSIDFDIKDAKNVLFLRYDRIGDMVITTPVFREIKLVYPHIKITVIASTANQDVLTITLMLTILLRIIRIIYSVIYLHY